MAVNSNLHGVERGKSLLAEFDGPTPKTPYRSKHLADIYITSETKL